MAANPSCGLYRTLFALPGAEKAVPAGALVYFHDHSEHGTPVVILPERAVDNRWQFSGEGHSIADERWPTTLVQLRKEGFYRAGTSLSLPGGRKLPEGLLVQLGYTRRGESVVFPGELASGTVIRFRSRGLMVTDLQADSLVRAGFKLMGRSPKTPAAAPASSTEEVVDEADGSASEPRGSCPDDA